MIAELLAADQWDELKTLPEKTVPIPPSTNAFAIVVRDDSGEIIARSYLVFPVTLMGVWIRPDMRCNVVGHEMFSKVEQKVKELGARMLLACIKPGTDFEGYAQRLGFSEAPWKHWKKDY